MWVYRTIKSLLDQNTISKNETIESKVKKLALRVSVKILYLNYWMTLNIVMFHVLKELDFSYMQLLMGTSL